MLKNNHTIKNQCIFQCIDEYTKMYRFKSGFGYEYGDGFGYGCGYGDEYGFGAGSGSKDGGGSGSGYGDR